VAPEGLTFQYTGTAVGPRGEDVTYRGCSPEEVAQYKLRQGSFVGQVINEAGGPLKISAGDGIHEGVWEAANTAKTSLGYENVNGIRWNDGNKWIVKAESVVKKNANGDWRVEAK
jgi:hypothetical protein